ncbi:uncharacterized protein LOC141791698 [Halichoeres trimaculatus]|uniref:uncharacterized protein LOC141791698 n=1 Tax=Halichoeres trimaculatus TaxID=147232 RepID=UPI003D9EA81E
METSVQGRKRTAKKGRNKTQRNVVSYPTTQAPLTEARPVEVVEEELDDYFFNRNVSKKRRNKVQTEVNLASSFPLLVRDYTEEELAAEGCRKVTAYSAEPPTPRPAEASDPLPEGQPGPQPGPKPAQSPEPQPAEPEEKPVPAFKISYSAVVSGKQQVSQKKALTKHQDTKPQETKPSLIQISELDFHSLVSQKELVSRLEEEKATLLGEVEKLKEQLQTQEAKAASKTTLLLAELTDKQATAREAISQTEELRQDLETERRRHKETEESLVQQRQETTRLQAYVHHIVGDFQHQGHMWGQEKYLLYGEIHKLHTALQQAQSAESRSHLSKEVQTETCTTEPAQNQAPENPENSSPQLEKENPNLLSELEEITKLKAALNQAQKDLKDHQQQLEEERSHRLSDQEQTSNLKAALNQAQKDLKDHQQQLEEERSHRLSDQEQTSKLKAALNQAQEDLKTQRQQWEGERSGLLVQHEETTCTMEAALRQAQQDTHNVKSQWEKERFL